MDRMTAVAEPDSEKPKRGRPRLMNPAMEGTYRALFNVNNRKSAQNRAYARIAIDQVKDADDTLRYPEYRWLVDLDPGGTVKWTILAELGRVEDDQQREAIARTVCRLKMTTALAVAFIRQQRFGDAAGNANHLGRVLLENIDLYRARYSAMHPSVVARLLRVMAEGFDQEAAEMDGVPEPDSENPGWDVSRG